MEKHLLSRVAVTIKRGSMKWRKLFFKTKNESSLLQKLLHFSTNVTDSTVSQRDKVFWPSTSWRIRGVDRISAYKKRKHSYLRIRLGYFIGAKCLSPKMSLHHVSSETRKLFVSKDLYERLWLRPSWSGRRKCLGTFDLASLLYLWIIH